MKTSLMTSAYIGLLLLTGACARFIYMGTNEAGADFGGSNLPGAYMVDYTFPRTTSIDYFVSNGLNTFRIPFLWERIQPTLGGAFDPTYLGYLDSIVQYITVTKGAHVVLDVHNYARYNNVILGEGVDYSLFQSLWQQLANHYKSNPNVIFGLMNEPNTMPDINVYLAMQAGINGIRACGATNLILVPGNAWTGAHSWLSGSSAVMSQIVDPLNNFYFEMHQYFDNNFSGNGACVATFDPEAVFGDATNWLRQQGRSGFLGEFGIENTPQCLAVLDRTMAYLQANSDVWQGFTWWAAGPWWGSYKFSLEQGVGDAQLAVIKQYLTSSQTSAVPVPSTTAAPLPSTTAAPVPSTTAAPIPSTTAAPVPSTTAAPVPSTTAAPVPSTTAAPVPSTTAAPLPSTTAAVHPIRPLPLSTGRMSTTAASRLMTSASVLPATTAATLPSTTQSNGGSFLPPIVVQNQPLSTPPPAHQTPNAATPNVATPTSTGSTVCNLGDMVCATSETYHTCTNGRDSNYWAPVQSCQVGLTCHPNGNKVYCY